MDCCNKGLLTTFFSALSLSVFIGIAGCGGGGGSDTTTTTVDSAQPGANQAALGPLSGAAIRAYRLTELNSPIEGPLTAAQSTTDLTLAGSFDLALSGIPDAEWVLVTATGGSDIDADDDGVADTSVTANNGTIHALAKASDWRAGAKVNVLTELAWQAVAADVQAGDTVLLETDLKWVANNLIGTDITGDGLIDYADLIAFDPANATHRYSLVFNFNDFFSIDGSGGSLIDYIHQANVSAMQARTAELFSDQLTPIRVPDLIDVTVNLNLPVNRVGLTASDLIVSSFVSDTAQVMDSTTPTLMMAEDSMGRTVMLGYVSAADAANYQMGAESTAMALATMSMGNVSAKHRDAIVDMISNHVDFPALVSAVSVAMAADPYFLDSLLNYTTLTNQLKSFATAILSDYTDSLGEPSSEARLSARIDPGAAKTFWFGSPWDENEPWYWYGTAQKYDVLDPPFIAEAQNNIDKLAAANPTNINYAIEYYDQDGNLSGWRLAARNSTLIQKAVNSGAAQTLIDTSKYNNSNTAHIQFNKYFKPKLSDLSNTRFFSTFPFHFLHALTGLVNVAADGSFLKKATTAFYLNSEALVVLGNCSVDMVSSVDYSTNIGDFIRNNWRSISETAVTGCLIPAANVVLSSQVDKIQSQVLKTTTKFAVKITNPSGWAMIIFNAGNELAPFGTSLLFADRTVGYDLIWNGSNLLEVSRNDNIPTGAATEPPAEIHPTASYSVTTVSGLTYQFDASLSKLDPSATPNYEWSIDGTLYSAQSSVNHTFSTAGEKDVRLTVYDGLGNSDEVFRKEIITNGQPPLINSIGCQQSSTVTNEAFAAVKVIEQDYPISKVEWFLNADDASPAVYWTPGGGFVPTSGQQSVLNGGVSGTTYLATLTYPSSTVSVFAPRMVATDSVGNQSRSTCLTSVDHTSDYVVSSATSLFSEDFSTDPGLQTHITSNMSGLCAFRWENGSYYAQLSDVSTEWYCLAELPVFRKISSGDAFKIEFDFNPVTPDWGNYPGLFFIDSSSGYPQLTRDHSMRFSINWSDNIYKKFTLTGSDGSKYFSSTIPANDEWYHVVIQRNGNTSNLDLVITREDGSAFVNELGLAIETGGFDQIFIGEYQGAVKYGSFAEIRVDNISVQ